MTNKYKTILVVDDVEANRDILAKRLEKDGYNVELAANGEEGLEILRSSLIDIVLLDIMMPEVDGISLLGQIRADSMFDDVVVIMLTALDNENVALDCLRRGACGYITKPYQMDQLRDKISECLKTQPKLVYSKD